VYPLATLLGVKSERRATVEDQDRGSAGRPDGCPAGSGAELSAADSMIAARRLSIDAEQQAGRGKEQSDGDDELESG
jgi:hypothetical protein